MSQLLKTLAILTAAAYLLLLSPVAVAAGPDVNCPYPPMPAGVSSGSVSARVTASDVTHGIPDAIVAIVNATNASIVYAIGHTDGIGNYTFTDVNSTGGAAAYRVIAIKDGYNDGDSISFGVTPSNTTHTFVICQALITPTPTPVPPVDPRVSSGTGLVSGRIKMGNGQGLSDAIVQVAGSGEYLHIAYATGHTDSDGRYAITMASVSSEPAFMLVVKKDGYVDAYSIPFSLGPSASVTINLTDYNVYPTPTPQAQVTPSARPTATPAPTPAPSPGPTQNAATATPSPSSAPGATASPSVVPATVTPGPGPDASATPKPAPGPAAAIAVISLAAGVMCRKRE